MPDSSHLLPLKPNWLHILLTLMDGPHHGYAIMQEVEKRTEGKIKLWPATLYGTIRRLKQARLIKAVDIEPQHDDDERRQYYAMTPFGGEVLRAEVERLEKLVKLARTKEAWIP